MKKFIINKLYIFSTNEKKAKAISFAKGKNIITSDKSNGNNRGKSVILKSIYHVLGADCFFDSKWKDENPKTYVLDFNINDKKFYILRYNDLFKIFNENFEKIHESINRKDLAEFLAEFYEFAVELPDRNNEKLEYASPVYNYILNYIDQVGMKCTHFSSFNNLGQYKNYKENVLYYHFGVFDRKYYSLLKEIEELKEKEKQINEEKKITQNMLEIVDNRLNNFDYSQSIEILNIEIEENKKEYTEIVENLNKVKNNIISLKNEREKIKIDLRDLNIIKKKEEAEIRKIEKHVCPLCNHNIEENISILASKYNSSEDLFILDNELKISIMQIEKEIEKEENKYKNYLAILNKYEEKLKINNNEVKNIIEHKGLIEIKENFIKDLKSINEKISTVKEELDLKNKEKKKYDDKKTLINKKYNELMKKDRDKFGLEEIYDKDIKNIQSTYNIGGSNMVISTIMWYINLLKIKEIFNGDVIKFPMIIDSPKSGELDENNTQQVFKYIFEELNNETQLIIATLGFENNEYTDINFDNIITLENEKYNLLNEQEYEDNKTILFKLQ